MLIEKLYYDVKIAIIKNIAYFVRFKEKYSFAQVFSLFLLAHEIQCEKFKRNLCAAGLI